MTHSARHTDPVTARPARRRAGPPRGGLALMELVLALLVVGLIAAAAVPRLGRASAPDPAASIGGDLAVLRSAVELYAADHGGAYPSLAGFEAQLTGVTDGHGPYLRAIPPLPAGAHAGATSVVAIPPAAAAPASGAWLYDPISGQIWPNHPVWR